MRVTSKLFISCAATAFGLTLVLMNPADAGDKARTTVNKTDALDASGVELAAVMDTRAAGGVGAHSNAKIEPATRTDRWVQSEIQALHSATSVEEQQKVVQELVLKIGAEKAQDELLHSGLPFTGDSHLMVHQVGTTVYEKYGLAGIGHCRPYFLGACYHGFLMEAVGQRGPGIMAEIWPKCEAAGRTMTTQCAHAVGHGLLVWKNNSIHDALGACDSVMDGADDFVASDCYDGVFMENIWGHHHHEHSAKQASAVNDLEYPCDDPLLEPRHLPACWENQVSLLYRAFQGDLAKIGDKCETLADWESKESCYDGLAQQIQPLTEGKANEAFSLCTSAVAPPLRNNCIVAVAEGDFAMGDQSVAPFEICKRIDARGHQECYERLFRMITMHSEQDLDQAARMCARISEVEYADACRDHLAEALHVKKELVREAVNRIATDQQRPGGSFVALATLPQAQGTHPYPSVYRYPKPPSDPYKNNYKYPTPPHSSDKPKK